MNPVRAPAPSRFIRGRARGGGAYRPYFYFKRNGRTIPAHSRGRTNSRGRRGAVQAATTSNIANRLNNVPASTLPATNFLRPQIYAAPEDRQQNTQSVEIEVVSPYPGWRLYFYNEPYSESSDSVQRVKHMENHFKDHIHYDYLEIHRKGYFELKANVVNQDENLMEDWPTLMSDLSKSPLKTLCIIGTAMHSLVTLAAIDESLSQQDCSKMKYIPKLAKPRKIYVRPIGFITEGKMSCINSLEIDQLYCVRGRVKEIGPVDAAASWIAYKCMRCKQDQAVKQSAFRPTLPTCCKRQGCLAKHGFIEMRSSPFTRITPKQMIRLAEARLDIIYDFEQDYKNYIDVELKYDLVDSIYLGQEIVVTGALKMRPLQNEQTSEEPSTSKGAMEIFLKGFSIVDAKYCKYKFNAKDLEAITMINGEEDSFKLLVNSLAPEVHGNEVIKAGALLSLMGGSGSQVHDEEEINVLLVGDPGVGKSNIALQCCKISERGCLLQAKRGNTTNSTKLTHTLRGNSKFTLESGALYDAAHGHCSIDDIDRLATHQEVLSNAMQSKLSCLATPHLCITTHIPSSVIATANSVSGHYDQSKLLTENIRINPNLLSEFHLVFVMLDKPSKAMDTSLTEHVRALHAGTKRNCVIANKFEQKPKTNNSMNISIDEMSKLDEDYNLNLRLKLNPMEESETDLLPTILLKKFIAYARQQVKPLFVPESAEVLKKFYLELRKQSAGSHSPVSSGHLAGLMRLCQARARIDFSSEVTKLHVRDVISMVRESNSDLSVGDYVDRNPATAIATINSTTGRAMACSQGNLRKFVQLLQARSGALSRRIFEFEELKEMARRVGIHSGVTNLIDIVNLQGILLKKGPNIYEIIMD